MSLSFVFNDLEFCVPEKQTLRVSGKIESHERVILQGPSGCGKTTFLRTLASLWPARSGSACLGERIVTNVDPSETRAGLVFQSGALIPHLNVWENVAFGLRFQNATRDWSRDLMFQHVREKLEKLGLVALAERSVGALSGGERQRVALLRTLIVSPDYLLLDEPLSALDPAMRTDLQDWILTVIKEKPVPTIIVTHDASEADRLGTRRVLWKGEDACLQF